MSILRIVFLGTPEVVVEVLEKLASAQEICEIVLVVTQKPARRGRGAESRDMPSAVHARALELGLEVATPEKIGEASFIEQLGALAPDVCVTAAYGQYLPERFLKIPLLGTINIHPSLLPAFRGASPVQRALEAGIAETGVSLLMSGAQMDAGPLVAQIKEPVLLRDDAAVLLGRLFTCGANALLDVLQKYQTTGKEGLTFTEQNHAKATFAAKNSAEEGIVSPFLCSAQEIVWKMKAFSIWPGVKMKFYKKHEVLEVKIKAAKVLGMAVAHGDFFAEFDAENSYTPVLGAAPGSAVFDEHGLWIRCKDGASVLQVTQLQLPGKNSVTAAAARNGWPGGLPLLVDDENK